MKYVIVGGGILGLSTARALRQHDSGAEIIVLEKEAAPALHQTGRNSGVVHAGLYYVPGSLKATLCQRGTKLLREFCAHHDLQYQECGKVVVATEESELGRLHALHQRATDNAVPGLRLLDRKQLRALEPHAEGIAALHSPRTAIVDYARVAQQLVLDLDLTGVSVRTGAPVAAVIPSRSRPGVTLTNGVRLDADRVLVCAGLHTDRLARTAGEARAPQIIPFRGEYWRLRTERQDLVRGLIYPVPDPTLPFLGIHLTKRTDGAVWIGPNAVLALAREGYRRRDVRWADLRDIVGSVGLRRLMRRHWRTGIAETARSMSKRLFVAAARRYLPELRPGDVVPERAGVRAQALDDDGSLVDDFRLSAHGNVVWVRNAPSPAATSALAIGEELADRLMSPG